MRAGKFFDVPWYGFDEVGFRRLRLMREARGFDPMAEYGRWHVMLGLLYADEGVIDYGDAVTKAAMAESLLLDAVQLDEYVEDLCAVGFVDEAFLDEFGKLTSHGVCDQIAHKRSWSEKSAAGGKASAESRRKKKLAKAPSNG